MNDPVFVDREDLRRAAQEWLKWLRLERGARPTTVKCWRSAMRCFLELLPPEPTREQFYTALQARLPSDRKAVRSKTWDALRSFYRWWEPRGGMPWPLPDMPAPRQSKARREPLSEEQLLAALVRIQTAKPKAKAMLYTLLLAGARPSDVVGLHLEDLDFTAGRERIRFRDRKSDGPDDWHPMSPVLADVVRSYLQRHPIPGGYLYPGYNGRMTTQAISACWQRVVRDRKLAREMPGAGMPSQMRKWFAVRLKLEGVDVDNIRELLGHADLATTQIYLRSDVEEGRPGILDLGAYVRAKEASAGCDQLTFGDLPAPALIPPRTSPRRPRHHTH